MKKETPHNSSNEEKFLVKNIFGEIISTHRTRQDAFWRAVEVLREFRMLLRNRKTNESKGRTYMCCSYNSLRLVSVTSGFVLKTVLISTIDSEDDSAIDTRK